MTTPIMYALATILWLTNIQAAEVAATTDAAVTRGKQLVEQNCFGCHDTDPYTNEDRAVQSLTGLQKRVQMCVRAQGLSWGPAEIADAVAYLNAAFYKVD